ncbi:MAG: universal stress protein [Acidobacteria bacterium]|nr:universal stress protein [Acidobacteriota bacterium]
MKFTTIVLGTDFSEASFPAVQTGMLLAAESGAHLCLVHVIEEPVNVEPWTGFLGSPATELYESAVEQVEKAARPGLDRGLRMERIILFGNPARKILELARERDADLIVIGTHGRRGLTRFLVGSTAEEVLREAPCQVLVVKKKIPAQIPKEASEFAAPDLQS